MIVSIHWLLSRGDDAVDNDPWPNGCCQSLKEKSELLAWGNGLLDLICLRDISWRCPVAVGCMDGKPGMN